MWHLKKSKLVLRTYFRGRYYKTQSAGNFIYISFLILKHWPDFPYSCRSRWILCLHVAVETKSFNQSYNIFLTIIVNTVWKCKVHKQFDFRPFRFYFEENHNAPTSIVIRYPDKNTGSFILQLQIHTNKWCQIYFWLCNVHIFYSVKIMKICLWIRYCSEYSGEMPGWNKMATALLKILTCH